MSTQEVMPNPGHCITPASGHVVALWSYTVESDARIAFRILIARGDAATIRRRTIWVFSVEVVLWFVTIHNAPK